MPSSLPPLADPASALPTGWMRPDFAFAVPDRGEARVHALMSARDGGISQGPYASCNLGDHVQDDAQAVRHNRAVFAQHLGAQPVWLQQVHGDRVLRLSAASLAAHAPSEAAPEADGALTTEPGIGCVVMVADCLPLLLAAPEGRGVAALHAGWRGLAGVLVRTVRRRRPSVRSDNPGWARRCRPVSLSHGQFPPTFPGRGATPIEHDPR